MKMKNWFKIGALAGLPLLMAAPAQATLLGDLLTFDGPECTTNDPAFVIQCGGEDAIKDESRSAWVDSEQEGEEGYGEFSVGDIVYGIVSISDVLSSGELNADIGGSDQLVFLFSVTIEAAGTGNNSWELGATDVNSVYSVQNFTNVEQGFDADTLLIGVSTTSSTTNPLDQTALSLRDGSYYAGWTWEMTVGLVADTDFFHFQEDGFAGGPRPGTEVAAMTIQDDAYGANWLPTDIRDFNSNVVTGDFAFDGTVKAPSASMIANGWDFQNDSDALVNPVPAPATPALLGLGLVGILLARRRRMTK